MRVVQSETVADFSLDLYRGVCKSACLGPIFRILDRGSWSTVGRPGAPGIGAVALVRLPRWMLSGVGMEVEIDDAHTARSASKPSRGQWTRSDLE